jgi:catechol 2,3-dioxygenase-like lactoylglutathione lyase family enzyme
MESSSTRKAALVAAHSVHEFVFSVPDIEEARTFYTAFGLDVRDDQGGLALHTFGHPHRWARIIQAQGPKRLRWIAIGIDHKDVAAFNGRVDSMGVRRLSAPTQADEGSATDLWIEGPDRLPVLLKPSPKTSPSSPAPRQFPPAPRNSGRSPSRSQAQPARPLYLSHILMFTADVDQARAFYENVLGLRLSDRSGSIIAFLHTPHGSDHHLIALAKSDGPGLHHSSWCVPSIDDVGMGAQQMVAAGYEQGWGIGRHVLGSNYFRYVRDPWGSFAEYSYDIDFVEAGQAWPAADHPPEDSLYVWGPSLPADFVTNHETAPIDQAALSL